MFSGIVLKSVSTSDLNTVKLDSSESTVSFIVVSAPNF